jgi:predicted nucleic acid-binding Zn ribbon protein
VSKVEAERQERKYALDAARYVREFKEFKPERREKLAAKGHALPDGSYPIENCSDAMNAVHAIGRAPEGKRAAVKAHIRKRVKALGCTNVGAEWGGKD